MIDAADLQLFQYVDDPPTALALLKAALSPEPEDGTPAFARSRRSSDE